MSERTGPVPALDTTLPTESPDLFLEAIVQVLAQLPTNEPNELLAVLAAGPLEDLLRSNSVETAGSIELLARQKPSFRLLLNGVWLGDRDAGGMERLAKYRTDRW